MPVDRSEFEFKSVRVLRGAEARAIAKAQVDGWEVDAQTPGRLRTELVFRRPRPKTARDHLAAGWASFRRLRPRFQRGIAACSAAIVAAAVVAGALMLGNRPAAEAAPVASASPLGIAATPAAASPTASPAPTMESSPENERVLTVKNSEDLADVLKTSEPDGDTVQRFAAEHAGETIAFNGAIVAMQPHGGYTTRYDILISAGHFDKNRSRGPQFQYEDVNTVGDLHFVGDNVPDTIGVGDELRVVAVVGEYDGNTGLFHLDPVSTRFID